MKIKWTWILVIIICIGVIFFLIEELTFRITSDMIYAIVFLGIGSLVVVFMYYYMGQKGLEFAQLDVFDIAEIIKQKIYEQNKLKLSLSETCRITTKTFEENNKTYIAYRFNVEDGPIDVTDAIVIWDCKDNQIADIDYDPSQQRRQNPFFDFKPVEGKYKEIPYSRTGQKINIRLGGEKPDKTKLDIGENDEE